LALLAVTFPRATEGQIANGVAVAISQNFTGTSGSGAWNPNPTGAAGADYYVEFLAVAPFEVYSKADGSLVQSTPYLDFWNQAGVTIPAGWYVNTARVVYDPTVQRWFVSEATNDPMHNTNTFQFLLAVSATDDPTGAWSGVSLAGDPGGNNYAAQLSMGLDAQGVYLSASVWDANQAIVDSTFLSIPKADLLANPPIVTNRTWFPSLTNQTHGGVAQPAVCLDGSAGGDVLAAGHGFNFVTGTAEIDTNLFGFSVQNAGGPGPAILRNAQVVIVPPYIAPNNAMQPDGSTNLVDWDSTFTANVYRLGSVLFAAHSTQVGAHPAIRWYRLSATNHALLESGTISEPNLDLFYPSIAANTNGTVVIACNGSGAHTYVSCYAAVGRTVNGVTEFGNLLLLKAGVASYQNGGNSWGVYSSTCVDPKDPNVFWTINMFAADTTTWSTQITQLLTSPSPRLSIANTSTNLLLSWPVTAVPFQLKSTPSLTGASSWSPVTAATVTNGNTVLALVPASGSGAFFRLLQSQ
jgi:hypothetical protein